MTRINLVPPSELSREHLVAEYRELPRVFGLIRRAIERGEQPDDPRNPTTYTLGKGHVRFFYPRCFYLHVRFQALVQEMQRRGYTVNHPEVPAYVNDEDIIPESWYDAQWDWAPSEEEIEINRARIRERTPDPIAEMFT